MFANNPVIKNIICAFGWSLAYPLIKIGYEQFAIPSSDLGGKIIFAGVRFFFALIPVLGVIFASLLLHEELKWQYFLAVVMVACGIWLVNRTPHNQKQKPATKE